MMTVDFDREVSLSLQHFMLECSQAFDQALQADALFERFGERLNSLRRSHLALFPLNQHQELSVFFDQILNDFFLAHKSHLTCPLW